MSRISGCFTKAREQSRSLFIPYIMAGDPQIEWTVPLMHQLVRSGADIIELGVPFSDPTADGPVIQTAAERALENDVSLKKVIGLVSEFRRTDNKTPVVLMGYLNPVEAMGYKAFAETASQAGVDGVLTVDLPPEEAIDYLAVMVKYQLDTIFLIAPTTTKERMKRICAISKGYVYYVSLKGITGAGHLDFDAVKDKMREIRQLTALPVGIGFGIKNEESAIMMGQIADAVIVGSAIVSLIEQHAHDHSMCIKAVGDFVDRLTSACRK